MKPQIIGTGLSGLVGSRVVEMLKNKYDFVDFSLETGVDILNESQLQEKFLAHPSAKAVIHLAAFTDTTAAWTQRGDKKGLCYQLNVIGTQNIVNLCRRYHKYLVYISTDFVFDGTKNGSYTETDTPNPIEWYGQTKKLAEDIVKANLPNSAVARIAFPYRATFTPKKDIVRKIIDGFAASKLNPFFTDQITTPTFIDDIANSLDYFFTNQPVGTYHLVGSSSQSPYDLALKIADIFNFDHNLVTPGSLVDYQKTLPPDSRPWQLNLALSNNKIKSLGLNIKDLTAGLKTMKEQLSGINDY